MVAEGVVETPFTAKEAVVLPLHYPAIYKHIIRVSPYSKFIFLIIQPPREQVWA